jgi:hypothetical protein
MKHGNVPAQPDCGHTNKKAAPEIRRGFFSLQ